MPTGYRAFARDDVAGVVVGVTAAPVGLVWVPTTIVTMSARTANISARCARPIRRERQGDGERFTKDEPIHGHWTHDLPPCCSTLPALHSRDQPS